ncbi:MAG TPA: LuxR C-terminal-related transcriptional regulator [Acetobacteraceae bacterium]
MVTETDYTGFLDLLYGAPVEQADWEPVITRFADMIGGAKAWMPDLDMLNGGGRGVTARIDPRAEEIYVQHFASRNPFIRRYATGPWPLAVMTDEDSFPKDEFVRTEYYNDFLRPLDIHSVAVVRLARRNGLQSTLNVTKPKHKGQFTSAELEIARRLHPHLIRAFNLSRTFADLRARSAGLAAVLDRSSHGVLLLDDTGRINHANVAAERLLGEGDGLRVVGGRLGAWRSDIARRLEALIGQAGRRDGAGRTGGSMALPTRSRLLPLSLTVAPLRIDRPLARTDDSVLVCVTDLAAGISLPVQRLSALFGLTPAEGRVALALFEGATPGEVAVRFDVSPRTVRVQLTRVFEKTGTNRQAELARLMMRMVVDRLD